MFTRREKEFLNFKVDHMTLLVQPEFYNVSYVIQRILFGVAAEDILYNKARQWTPDTEKVSMTYASMLGEASNTSEDHKVDKTILAVVQPSEPKDQPSHVRQMLAMHNAAAHWQHIALRTPDLLSFHEYALARGVAFITPILKDEEEDLIQVFTGEWTFPGQKPSGVFFEFVQRNPSDQLLNKLEQRNRESWFQDKTFLGLYNEKEREYQSGTITPFLCDALFLRLKEEVGSMDLDKIDQEKLERCEKIMLEYGEKQSEKGAS